MTISYSKTLDFPSLSKSVYIIQYSVDIRGIKAYSKLNYMTFDCINEQTFNFLYIGITRLDIFSLILL